jgi:hypothetical protein
MEALEGPEDPWGKGIFGNFDGRPTEDLGSASAISEIAASETLTVVSIRCRAPGLRGRKGLVSRVWVREPTCFHSSCTSPPA